MEPTLFWERFQTLCARRGKAPNAVGRELGLSSATTSQWKRRGSVPSARVLAMLALCSAMLPFNSSAGVYVRLTITKARSGTAMHTAEFAVYDTSGTRVNLNLTKAGLNVNVADLSEGQYTVDFADNSNYGEVSTKLFDGNTGTKLYWSNVSASNPISITMRLGDAAQFVK